jgi:hypothetical protein
VELVAQTNSGPLTETGFGPRMAGDNAGYREVFAKLNLAAGVSPLDPGE